MASKVPIAVLVAGVLFAAPAAAQSAATDDIVAKLGSTQVSLSDVQRLLDAQSPQVRQEVLKTPEALDRLVRIEIFRKALLAEARAKGWDKRSEVQEQLQRLRDQVVLSAYVNDLTRPPADYPSEAEVAAAYQANETELTAHKQYRLSQIFVADGEKADADGARRRAEELARTAREKGADFAALARDSSEHKPSADAGGDTGWVSERDMVAEIRAAVSHLATGDVSAAIRTAQGWHVVKLVDSKPAAVRPLSEVHESLVALLRQRRAQENERRYLDAMAARTPLTVNPVVLGRLQAARDAKR